MPAMGPELGNLVVQIVRFADVRSAGQSATLAAESFVPVADSPLGRGLSDWGHPDPYSLKRRVVELDGDRHVHTAAIREPFAQAPASSPLR
jgi:hypothetical protein